MSGEPEEDGRAPVVHAGSLRRACLRGALAAGLGALGALAFTGSGGTSLAHGLLVGALGGLVVVPVTFAELACERWAPSWRSDALVTAAVWALAALGTFAAYIQSLYTLTALQRGGAAGVEQLSWVLGLVGRDPLRFLCIYGAVGVPFAAVALARRRRLRRVVIAPLSGAALISMPLLFMSGQVPNGDARFAFFMTCVACLALPLVYRWGDLVERRLWAEAPDPDPPAPDLGEGEERDP